MVIAAPAIAGDAGGCGRLVFIDVIVEPHRQQAAHAGQQAFHRLAPGVVHPGHLCLVTGLEPAGQGGAAHLQLITARDGCDAGDGKAFFEGLGFESQGPGGWIALGVGKVVRHPYSCAAIAFSRARAFPFPAVWFVALDWRCAGARARFRAVGGAFCQCLGGGSLPSVGGGHPDQGFPHGPGGPAVDVGWLPPR